MIAPRNDEYLLMAEALENTYRDAGHGRRDTHVDTLGYGLWMGRYVERRQAMGHEPAVRSVLNEIALIEGRPVPFPAPGGRVGRVRLEGRVMADDDGPHLALGASLFWAVLGAAAEPDRLRANALWLRERGVDFVRVMVDTTDWSAIYEGGPGRSDTPAHDRRTNPLWAGFPAALASTRDILAECGLRVAWTIFGGNQLDALQRERAAADLLEVCRQRPETVQYIEISNENNGAGLSLGEYKRYVIAFERAGFLVAPTSVTHGPVNLYANCPTASLATMHFERTRGDNGWRPVRQGWGYPDEYREHFGPLPMAWVSGEPIGPGSSVASETDPLVLAMQAVHTWLLGGCAHVVHFGAGIFGVPTHHPVGGPRPANVWEQESLAETLSFIQQYRTLLPTDLPNWARTRHGRRDHPFTFPPDPLLTVGDEALNRKKGCVRAYAAYRGGRFVCVPIGVMGRLDLEPQHSTRSYSITNRAEIIIGDYTG